MEEGSAGLGSVSGLQQAEPVRPTWVAPLLSQLHRRRSTNLPRGSAPPKTFSRRRPWLIAVSLGLLIYAPVLVTAIGAERQLAGRAIAGHRVR
jgi:hypothetical protein